MIAVTGATGHLGRLVIDELLKTTQANNIIAAVRTPAKATGLAVSKNVAPSAATRRTGRVSGWPALSFP